MTDMTAENEAGDLRTATTDGNHVDIPVFARDLCKAYEAGGKRIPVLDHVDFSARWGSSTAILGPSGCGKSTLLYCLAGLEPVTSGTVTLLGRDLTRMSPSRLAVMRRGDIGFMFQDYNLVPSLTVEQNIMLPLRLGGRPVDRARLDRYLRDFGLEDRRTSEVTVLSGGERQRTALIRVLMAEPRVVFADEPTGALDQASGQLVIDELTGIAASPDRCVIIVTHSAEVAARCDVTVTMRDGTIVGTTRTRRNTSGHGEGE